MTVLSRIRDLVQDKLAGRKIDIEGFADELLLLAREAGEVQGTLATDRVLRLEVDGQHSCEVEVDRAKTKLRMLCARLGVLCNQSGLGNVSLYGGEGVIEKKHSSLAQHEDQKQSESSAAPPQVEANRWTVRFKNTSSEQGFTIIPLGWRRLPVTAS
ncbi:MAG: hypothetical protein HYS12_11540 [Planctomycetes bacterium]|nr:hypothetical protein [Planctomycetota bacterium]